jgi:hypothetical protein
MKKTGIFFAILVLALLAEPLLQSQEFRASIVGRVLDSSGAAVPGAEITATNSETGAVARSRSGGTGDYLVTSLPPGRYKIEVRATGFRSYIREGITLQIQERSTLDVRLDPGDISTSITVSADASPLETATSSSGEVISGRTVMDIPLNGRNPFALAVLAPAVVFTNLGQGMFFVTTTSNLSISGLQLSGTQSRASETLIDGIPNTGSNGTVQFLPSVDSVTEFKIQTDTFDAGFGRFTGGVINTTTQSGANQVHGNLYEFVRNSRFNARDFFATSIPQFGYNLYGGSIGGPVQIPKIYKGKNRTFFFFNIEGEPNLQPRTFVSSIPTALQRQGNFSQTGVYLPTGGSSVVTIYDPATLTTVGSSYTRSPFPGNIIPATRFDPVALNLLKLYPAPNVTGDPVTGANNLNLSFHDLIMQKGFVARIDHRFNDNHSVFLRYFWRHQTNPSRGNLKDMVTESIEHRNAFGLGFGDTYVFSPTTLLNFHVGVSRYWDPTVAADLGYDMSQLGLPASFTRALVVQAIPEVIITNYQSLSNTTKSSTTAEDIYTVGGALTKVVGRHNLRIGGEARVMRSYVGTEGVDAAGAFSFDSTFTQGPNPQAATIIGGSGLASFLLGMATSGSTSNTAAVARQAPYYGLYFQDDFRVNSRLSLNLGLRYEWEGGYTERFNRLNRGFDFQDNSPLATQAMANYALSPISQVPPSQFTVKGGLLFAGVNGQSRAMTDIGRDNVAPRVGAAFSLTPKTVLRGGYGIFYGPTTTTNYNQPTNGFSVTTPYVSSLNGGLTASSTLSNPFPSGLVSPSGSSLGLMTLVGQNVNYVDVQRRMPRAQQYQFGIQRELPGRILIDATYAGTLSSFLPVNQQLDFVPLAEINSTRSTYLATGLNVNNSSASNPFYPLITVGNLSKSTTTVGQLVLPYPQFTSLTENDETIGTSRYDSFQFKFNKPISKGVTVMVAYTIAKELDKTRYLNPQDTGLVKELGLYGLPQNLVVTGVYEFPLGPGKRFFGSAKGVARKLLEGYQLNVIYTAHSGVPLQVSGAESLGRSAKLTQGQTVSHWFDTSAFRQQQTLELVGVSTLPDVRAQGANNFDISLIKSTTIKERLRLQFRFEAFNAMNRPQFSAPNTTFGNANFGRCTADNNLTRQLQLALKMIW